MNVMSIDPSLNSTGITIRIDNDIYITKSIIVNKNMNRYEKLKFIYVNILHIVEKFNVKIAIIEDYAHGIFSASLQALSEARGVMYLALFEKCVDVIYINNMTWKSVIKFNPSKSAKKTTKKGQNEYINYAKNFTNMFFKNSDEVDSFMMLKACEYICNFQKYQEKYPEIFEKLKGVLSG